MKVGVNVRKIGIIFDHGHQMETFVPKESSREERPGGNASEKLLRTFDNRLCGSPGLGEGGL